MAGETVTVLGTTNPRGYPIGPAVAALHKTFECLTTELQLNDQWLVGYLPAGVDVLAAVLKTDDLDSGAEALVFSVVVGSTAFTAGTTLAQVKAVNGGILAGDHISTTADTPVYLKCTTAAATAVAGTINLTILYAASN